ncbi:CWF19-like protein 2 isoform X2 [Camellia sinensis]|uniref:CWF19-like protein 2 isoform X2 n=1 Tax=Camellia sinensis TaxID=4442 RepID=UPI0010360F44|nr:CWF19-like protein 2 isoform X2 [Camellia sinensis]
MEERVKRDREVWQRLRGRRGFCFQQSKKMKIKEPAKQIHGRRSSTFVALIMKENPRELNPYFKNNGTGYPEEAGGTKAGRNQLLSSAVVGDGGASWRLKALKRAQEQAAREGMALEEVVGEQWGSLGQLAVSVASRTAAPSRAHLRAIKNRKKGLSEEQQTTVDDRNEKVTEKNIGRERLRDRRHSEMKVPKLHDSLSWGKRKSQSMSSNKDSDLISTAMASLNKFANDGNFMSEVIRQQNDDRGGSPYNCERNVESEMVSFESQKPGESSAIVNQGMSANQLAAKALQLCLKGKHEEAEKLLKEVENIKAKQGTVDESSEAQNERNKRRQFFVSQLFIQFRYGTRDTSIQQRKKEDDADMHLAQKIAQNKQYSISGRADDEYDFDDGPRRKTRKKGAKDNKLTEKTNFPQRIFTQQERCQFCFENPSRPRHLVVAIANFTYLSLPHWQSIVPGHCCILTSQHESATRAVDNNVWDEIRNFKKCLIMMFAKQGKDVVFLETVMGLAQQRRHCMVECIPLPQDIAKQAPLYFKKAIDEAEGEWSQHNSKKLIDTSEKGLRGSIPKDFPYFHVEFELNKGFVHVMDDEKQFKSNFGLNVIRGMLRLPEEDMYGRRKHDSVETQKQAVARFVKDWEPFDWTKQLD